MEKIYQETLFGSPSNLVNHTYQEEVKRTFAVLEHPVAPHEASILNMALGLCGEAGEVADLLKKGVFHGHQINKDKLHEELGDVLWYIATIANLMEFDLEAIMKANVEKLKKRYPNGFKNSDSINRLL